MVDCMVSVQGGLLDNLRHDEKAAGLGGCVAQGFVVGERGADFVGARDIHERHGLGGRLDVADIHLAEFLDVANHLAKLRAELLFFFGRQADSREVRDVFHIDGRVWHDADGRGCGGRFKAEKAI